MPSNPLATFRELVRTAAPELHFLADRKKAGGLLPATLRAPCRSRGHRFVVRVGPQAISKAP